MVEGLFCGDGDWRGGHCDGGVGGSLVYHEGGSDIGLMTELIEMDMLDDVVLEVMIMIEGVAAAGAGEEAIKNSRRQQW